MVLMLSSEIAGVAAGIRGSGKMRRKGRGWPYVILHQD